MYYKKNIKYLREKRGVSQKRASADLGISRAVLGGYESGLTQPPLDKLQLLADYFGVPIQEFIHTDLSKIGDFKVAEEESSSQVSEPAPRYGDPAHESILIKQIGRLQKEVDELRGLLKKYDSDQIAAEEDHFPDN